MALTQNIDQLDTLITNRAALSEIIPCIGRLRDQAAALELRLQEMDAKAHDVVPYADYEDLRAKSEAHEKDAKRFREAYENLRKQNAVAHARNVAPGLQGMPVPREIRGGLED